MVVVHLVALQDADAGLDEQAARRHVVVAERTELLGGSHHRREIGGDDVLVWPFVAEVVDVGDLRPPDPVVVVALVLEARDRPRPVESRRRVEAVLRVGQIHRRGDFAVRHLMRRMALGRYQRRRQQQHGSNGRQFRDSLIVIHQSDRESWHDLR